MENLKENAWIEFSFKELVSENKKSLLKVSDASNFGNYKFYTSGENVLLHNDFLVEGENIFLATGGVANVKYSNEKVAYSSDTYSVKVRNGTVPKLLYYHLLKDLDYINYNYFQGSGLKHLQKKDLQKHTFFYPKNPVAQQKIADILTRMDDAIENTQAMIDKYENIKKGLMQDLLTKGIDENGNIRSEETHQFKDSPLGRIPVEWEAVKLGKYVNIWNGYAFRSSDFVESGVQLVRMGNLYQNKLSLERDPVYLPFEFSKTFQQFILKEGDLVMSLTGTSGKRDYGFVVKIDNSKPLLQNQRVAKFLYLEQHILKDYLYYLTQSEIYLSKLYEISAGTKQANLSSKDILDILCPIPAITEQKMIIQKLFQIDIFLKNKINLISKLSYQKKGLLKDLCSINKSF